MKKTMTHLIAIVLTKKGRAACPAGVRSPDFEEIYSEDEFGNEEFAGCGRQITH